MGVLDSWDYTHGTCGGNSSKELLIQHINTMKNFLFLYLGLFNLSISQNTISSDSISQLKEVEVIYKAHALSPITYQNITEDQIQELSVGQEPALLFSNTPSIISHADAGHTQGYSYFTLRGIDQTRINITLDGVPLNDHVI